MEKVGNLPELAEDVLAVLVVELHGYQLRTRSGRLSYAHIGRTRFLPAQEFWRAAPIRGLLEETNGSRGAALLRERASGVILVPKLAWDPLSGSFLVLNNLRLHRHLASLREELRHIPPLAALVEVAE